MRSGLNRSRVPVHWINLRPGSRSSQRYSLHPGGPACCNVLHSSVSAHRKLYGRISGGPTIESREPPSRQYPATYARAPSLLIPSQSGNTQPYIPFPSPHPGPFPLPEIGKEGSQVMSSSAAILRSALSFSPMSTARPLLHRSDRLAPQVSMMGSRAHDDYATSPISPGLPSLEADPHPPAHGPTTMPLRSSASQCFECPLTTVSDSQLPYTAVDVPIGNGTGCLSRQTRTKKILVDSASIAGHSKFRRVRSYRATFDIWRR